MAEDLYHPDHVDRELVRLDGMLDEAELFAAIRATGPQAVPPEVFVRLLRRCSVEANPALERVVLVALLGRVNRWVGRQYSGVSVADQEDLTQDLMLSVTRAIARQAGIDWWEIRFFFNLKNAAADLYQRLFDEGLKTATADIGDQAEELDDGGRLAKAMVDKEILHARLAEILDKDELELIYPLFLGSVPISSAKATIDLVRLLNIPAGTLREKKTAIKRRLEAALDKEFL